MVIINIFTDRPTVFIQRYGLWVGCSLVIITTVFSFTRPLGVFSSGENCVSAAVNHTIYGALTKLLLSVLQTCKGFCVFTLRNCKMFSLLHS